MGGVVNPEKYRDRLLALEREMTGRFNRMRENARDRGDGSAGDAGDGSSTDELRDEQLGEAELERTRLADVRAALARIEAGTFGSCAVDGEPIEEARLDAAPWALYCVRHQQQREANDARKATM